MRPGQNHMWRRTGRRAQSRALLPQPAPHPPAQPQRPEPSRYLLADRAAVMRPFTRLIAGFGDPDDVQPLNITMCRTRDSPRGTPPRQRPRRCISPLAGLSGSLSYCMKVPTACGWPPTCITRRRELRQRADGRWCLSDAFDMSSGVFAGRVEAYQVVDVTAGYLLPFQTNTRLELTIYNALGDRWVEEGAVTLRRVADRMQLQRGGGSEFSALAVIVPTGYGHVRPGRWVSIRLERWVHSGRVGPQRPNAGWLPAAGADLMTSLFQSRERVSC